MGIMGLCRIQLNIPELKKFNLFLWRNSKVVTGSRYIELIVPATNHLAEYLKSVERGKGTLHILFQREVLN